MVPDPLTLQKLTRIEPRQAAALLVARRAEGLAPGEQQLLEEWLSSDTTHREHFEHANRAWQAFSGAENNEILRAMRRHALEANARRSTHFWPLALAASLLIAVCAAWIVLERSSSGGVDFHYASGNGEVLEISLPDSSAMTLDAESTVVGEFGQSSRTVNLTRGRALFSVTPDTDRPFAVTAAGHRIVATGTLFEVNLLPGGLTITLHEGRVRVFQSDSSHAPIDLQPGQQYRERGGEYSTLELEGVGDSAAWRDGLLQFNDYLLVEAIAVVNRYSKDQILVRDPAVAALNVSGQFPAGDAQRFAETVAEMHRLRVNRLGQQVELALSE